MRAADVAAVASVSISTVSLVVNDKWQGRVAPSTVERVRAAVSRLGYVVDESARRLATGSTAAVAVVTPAFTNPFYARVSLGAAAALGAEHPVLFTVPEIGDDPTATVSQLGGLRLAGALLAAPSADQLRAVPPGLPTVVLDAPGVATRYPRVDLDVASGAGQLAEHLLSLGHRRVAYFRASPETGTFSLRCRALADALGRGGGRVVLLDRLVSDVDAGAAHRAALAAMPELHGAEVTAVVCATDLHAYGLLRACVDREVAVPGHWSVAGFDDQPLSAFVAPALTTVAFPADDLGRVAGSLLAGIIAGAGSAEHPGGAEGSAPTEIVLPVSLVVRTSSGAARCPDPATGGAAAGVDPAPSMIADPS